MGSELLACVGRFRVWPGVSDRLRWGEGGSGVYSSQGYCSLVGAEGSIWDKLWTSVWSGGVPSKVKGFLWKAVLACIPTLVGLARQGTGGARSLRCVL